MQEAKREARRCLRCDLEFVERTAVELHAALGRRLQPPVASPDEDDEASQDGPERERPIPEQREAQPREPE